MRWNHSDNCLKPVSHFLQGDGLNSGGLLGVGSFHTIIRILFENIASKTRLLSPKRCRVGPLRSVGLSKYILGVYLHHRDSWLT